MRSLLASLFITLTGCSSSGVSPSADAGPNDCVPACDSARRCGDDGCGGSCGQCPASGGQALTCTASGICKCNPTCTPDCSGQSCGDDGCGGSCGACSAAEVCAYEPGRPIAWRCAGFTRTSTQMSFFVTSVGNGARGADLGGLAGADGRCRQLAEAVGVSGKTWRAYLSVSGAAARDRIGAGPWRNARGVSIVRSDCAVPGNTSCVDALHGNGLIAELALTERGTQVDWRNAHDILTGSDAQGRPTGEDCAGWTSNTSGSATVGHSNGQREDVLESWNSAHGTGCDEVSLQCTASRAHLYCFAL